MPGQRFPLRILGIDPGSRFCGWSTVEYSDDLKEVCLFEAETKAFLGPIEDRVDQLATWLRVIIEVVTPDCIVMERQSIHSPGSHARVAMAVVAFEVKKAAHKAGIPFRELNRQRVYKIVCGKGHADKRYLRDRIIAMFGHLVPGLDKMSTDESDAAAMALAAPYYGKP